jgi:3-deoxy-D-manno-octulosonate 8-phosphate phosphatase (KDO 8-P phosphatase)
LPVIRWAGLGIAVQDAAAEVSQAADYVTKIPGGRGAVREVIELILKSKGRWDDLVRNFAI